MNSYRKCATAVQVISVIMMVNTLVLTALHWFFPALYKAVHASTGVSIVREYDASIFSFGQKVSGFLVESVATLLLVYGLVLVIRLMGLIKEKNYFNLESIKLLKLITRTALIYVIYALCATTILSIITTLHNPVGQRVIALQFGTSDLINIMVFCFLFIMLTLMQKGYELKHEQELTI